MFSVPTNPNFGALFKELLSNDDDSALQVVKKLTTHERLNVKDGLGQRNNLTIKTKVVERLDEELGEMTEVGDHQWDRVGGSASGRVDGGGDLRTLIGTMNSAISRGKETVRKKLDEDEWSLKQLPVDSLVTGSLDGQVNGGFEKNAFTSGNISGSSSLKNTQLARAGGRNVSRSVRFKCETSNQRVNKVGCRVAVNG